MSLSTHVLDTATGAPAAGVVVHLARQDPSPVPTDDAGDLLPRWEPVALATTDVDGRAVLLGGPVPAGAYQLRFLVGEREVAAGRVPFFPEVSVVVAVDVVTERLHVPLLLAPFGYTTYRGS